MLGASLHLRDASCKDLLGSMSTMSLRSKGKPLRNIGLKEERPHITYTSEGVE